MAQPLNLNAKNLPNADFFLVCKIYVYFLWASASELQPKTSAKNSAVLKKTKTKSLSSFRVKAKGFFQKSLNGRLHAKERSWGGLQFGVCGDNIHWRKHQLNGFYFLQLE